MRRNLLSIIILALLAVNLVLTSIMMVSVSSASKKTAALVSDIAEVVKLDISDGSTNGVLVQDVPIEDVEVYPISNELTIPLAVGEDGEQHYCLLSLALSMNKKSPGYKTHAADLSTKESLITGKVYDIVGTYTWEEAQANKEMMKDDILKGIQEMFNSDFIFQVSFSEIIFQ